MPAACVDGGRVIIDGAVVSRGAPACRKVRVVPAAPAKIAAPSIKPAAKRGRPIFFFKDCDEAWLAGKAPLARDDDGYRAELDPDGDGLACQSSVPLAP